MKTSEESSNDTIAACNSHWELFWSQNSTLCNLSVAGNRFEEFCKLVFNVGFNSGMQHSIQQFEKH